MGINSAPVIGFEMTPTIGSLTNIGVNSVTGCRGVRVGKYTIVTATLNLNVTAANTYTTFSLEFPADQLAYFSTMGTGKVTGTGTFDQNYNGGGPMNVSHVVNKIYCNFKSLNTGPNSAQISCIVKSD